MKYFQTWLHQRSTLMRDLIILFAVITSFILLLGTNSALAGPPFQTDDPEPLDVGEHELYVATEQTRTRDGSAGSLPFVELNYGAAADLQIGIGIPHEFTNPKREPSEHGIGDVEFSAKYRFLQETSDHPMVSFFPMVSLPTGDADKGLGNGKPQIFLPIWLQKNWGDWQSNAGGGYWINHAVEAKNHWFFGWQLQKRLSDTWTIGGEIFHSTEEVSGEGASTGFDVGGTYAFDEHNHLLFSVGRGLSNVQATNQFSSYLGYQLTW